jgi:HlyD family secretion protein
MFEARVRQADAALRNAMAGVENAKAASAKAEADLYSARAAETNQVASMAKAKVGVADTLTKLARRQKMYSDRIISKEDLDTAQATYDQAVADLRAAEAQHDAAVHNGQASEAAFNAANKTVAMFEAEVELNQAALNQARIDLEHTKITAPVDGTVIARRMDVGQTVAASFQAPTIFEIAQDLTKMQVDTNVAESDVGRVQVGQSATFTVDAYPGLVFEGRVTQIRQIDERDQLACFDASVEVGVEDLDIPRNLTPDLNIHYRIASSCCGPSTCKTWSLMTR